MRSCLLHDAERDLLALAKFLFFVPACWRHGLQNMNRWVSLQC